MPSFISGTGRYLAGRAESVYGTAPGTGSAKKFRRTQISLNLTKDRYQDDEIRDDMQKVLSQSGGERTAGTLDCGLSCGSHQELFEASLRQAATATSSMTALTVDVAIVGSGPTYTLTRSAGSYISAGLRVGMTIRATLGLNANNLNRNLAVVALTATVATVYPWDAATMTTEAAATGVTLTVPGKRAYVPSTGHIERSFYFEDFLRSDISRIFSGVEVGGFNLDLSPGQNAKSSFQFVGKSMTLKTDGAYYVSPTALSTARRLAGPRGVILIDGEVQAVMTQLQVSVNGNLTQEQVIGSLGSPAVGQGSIVGSGQGQLLLFDDSFIDRYLNDTPFEVLAYLQQNANDPDSPFMSFHMASCQANSADLDDGERLLKVGFPFEFAKKETATGYDETTIAVQDSAYV